MPELNLTADEAALITERRSRAARAEADRLEADAPIDVLGLSTAELCALPKDKLARAMRESFDRAMRGE